MKKRIFGLLLALCLIVGLLPISALAASEDATLSYAASGDFNTAPVSVTLKEGDAAKYFLTKAGVDANLPTISYLVADGATADNYNVKFEYAKGGIPTIYLKGAVITSDFGLTLGAEGNTFAAKVVVESDSTIAKTNSNAYRDHCLNFLTTGDVTITGAGVLTIHGSGRAGYSDGYIATNGNLIIKDAALALIEAPKYGDGQVYYGATAVLANGGDIIIDHSDIYADYNRGKRTVTNIFQATDVEGKGGNITIKNQSNVEIWSGGTKSGGCNAFNIPVDSNLKDDTTWLVTIENSNVEAGMCYHAATTYSVFNVSVEQIVLKSTDIAVGMVEDTAKWGEHFCDDIRKYNPEFEDEEEVMYKPLTVVYAQDEDGVVGAAIVEATMENGALISYEYIQPVVVPKMKYFKLTHVCLVEDDGDCTTAGICTSCGAEAIPAQQHVAAEDDGNCKTAILCANEGCTKEVVAAKTAHAYTDNKDTTCDNENCKHEREVFFVEVEVEAPDATSDMNLVVVAVIAMAAAMGFGITVIRRKTV